MFDMLQSQLSNPDSWLMTQVINNSWLIGIVSGGLLAAGTYLTRTVPRRTISGLWNFLTTEVTFNSDDSGFDLFAEYVLKKVIVSSFQRSYNLQFEDGEDVLSPGYGTHWGWVQRRPCIVSRTLIEGSATEKFKEQITLTVLGRRQRLLSAILGDSKAFIESRKTVPETSVRVFINNSDWWMRLSKKPKRTEESLVLKEGVYEKITRYIDDFVNNEEKYVAKGIPYHLGIFLDGKPGCGKSSLIHVLASVYGRSIYYLDLNGVTEERQLYQLMSDDMSNAFLVIEDIDATRVQTSRDENDDREYPISLSTILNVLDGIASPHGMICVATSNHKERLDPALIRKGRFDCQVEIGYMDWSMWLKMVEKFNRSSPITEDQFVPCPPVDASFVLAHDTDEEIVSYFEERKLNAGR